MDLLALYYNSIIKTDPNAKITMTSNEISVPTSTAYVADCILEVIKKKLYGTYHAVPMSEGISRIEFAEEVLKCLNGIRCSNTDLVEFKKMLDIKLNPIKIDSYYPFYSAMKSTLGQKTCWKVDLKKFVDANGYQLLKSIKDNII